MMKSKTTIEVNGKQYDAVTGAVIGVATAPPVQTGHNIDGFFRVRPSASIAPVASAEKITILAAPVPLHPQHHRQPERTINHARAHTPQATDARPHDHTEQVAQTEHAPSHSHHRSVSTPNHTKHRVTQNSKTLMRTSVQRPQPSFHKQAGTIASLTHDVPSLIVPKASVGSIDETRLARAQSTLRSPHVSHHESDHHRVQPVVTSLAVQPVPTPPVTTPKPGTTDDPTAAPPPKPDNAPPDIFQQALMNATNFVDTRVHVRHFKKQAKRHVASMAAGTLALVVIAGFAAYQNTPGLQFRVASVQAGISTSMPNFKAAGFAYNGVHAESGKLTIGFSNAGTKFQLTQQATNLSGGDMIANIGATDASGTPTYTTIKAGDTTVYRFDNTGATWVSNGTWYTVNGNGPLTNSQVEALVKNI